MPRAIRPVDMSRRATAQHRAMPTPAAATPSGRPVPDARLAMTLLTIHATTQARFTQMTAWALLISLLSSDRTESIRLASGGDAWELFVVIPRSPRSQAGGARPFPRPGHQLKLSLGMIRRRAITALSLSGSIKALPPASGRRRHARGRPRLTHSLAVVTATASLPPASRIVT